MSSVWNLVKYVLAPFALIYFVVIWVRNKLYDIGLFRTITFDLPVIAVGNLSVGGTGKTPHIEYLIRLLQPHYKLATLSRGYKRKTSGYLLARPEHHADHLGDEPSLLFKKYPGVAVAVAEDRTLAMPQLLTDRPGTQVTLLDDAFQRRDIGASMTILLTTYHEPYYNDRILPIGSLREYRSAAKRADIIVVTKCPPNLSNTKRKEMEAAIDPGPHQKVLFSYLQYAAPYHIAHPATKLMLEKDLNIYAFCGIANTTALEEYIRPQVQDLYVKKYPDHHYYDRYDLEFVIEAFKNLDRPKKVLLTTEKDVTRLFKHKEVVMQRSLPIFVLPVRVEFFPQDKAFFDREILDYLERVLPARN